MQDLMFVALSIVFFVVGIGYVAVCDRLMKWGDAWPWTTWLGSSWASGCSATWYSRCWSRRSS